MFLDIKIYFISNRKQKNIESSENNTCFKQPFKFYSNWIYERTVWNSLLDIMRNADQVIESIINSLMSSILTEL